VEAVTFTPLLTFRLETLTVKGLVHIAAGITVFMTSATLLARKKDPPRLEHLCGVIDHVQYIPIRGSTRSFTDKRTPLPSLSLVFYQQRNGENCCDGLKQIATTSTDKNGRFDVVNIQGGHYWLSTEWNNRAWKYAFDYPFSTDPNITCSGQGIDLKDDGSAQWWQTITLD
jgi:hypothetical protein